MELQNIKYYTPSIEEFHMGFEYEYLPYNEDYNTYMTTWIKAVPTEITAKGFKDQLYGLRVKYLDKSDIESLGWKEIRHSVVKIYNEDKTKFTFIPEEGITEYSEERGIYLLTQYGDSKQINIKHLNGSEFSLYIKNKSELRKLMKQLGI